MEDLTLEPRLREYLEKKRYYKKYNIRSAENLEKKYKISNQDIMLLTSYLKGEKIDSQKYYENEYFVKPTGVNFCDPMEEFKKSDKFKNIEKKNNKVKDAERGRHDMSGIDKFFTQKILDNNFGKKYASGSIRGTPAYGMFDRLQDGRMPLIPDIVRQPQTIPTRMN